MQQTLMQGGIDLMLYGMGTVIVFLTLLVGVTGIMGKLTRRYFPAVEEPSAVNMSSAVNMPSAVTKPSVRQVDAQTMAVIQAAIDKHRGRGN